MIAETRRRLKEWGCWACGGDPSVSSMFKVMFGRGSQSLTYMPDHIQEIDHIICTSPPDIRAILIKFYTQGGTIQDKAISIGLDRRTLMRRVDRADWYVHSRLDMLPTISASSRQNEFGVTKLRHRPLRGHSLTPTT
ncbi:MAG TPA: hypothetical protein VH724_15390 [Candidatus Angelobacter sp.]|jgi:hypothetical protein|nr:hypothetical protein [Candidatus Angelobacter sp.]